MAIEDTMAQLAHSQISQSLPSLNADIQGFQLIEGNENNNAAIGVIVALINNLCVYIPAIYRNGKIFNMDIMYIPEMRQWLPTQDNWITYLRSRRADLDGIVRERDKKAKKGTAASINLDTPFQNIAKHASDSYDRKYIERVGVPYALKEAENTLKKELEKPVSSLEIPTLNTLINKCASSPMARKVLNTIANNESIGNAFVQFYSDDDILDAAKAVAEAGTIGYKEKVKPTGTVKIMTSASAGASDLSDDEKIKILRDGAVISDTRGLVPTKIYKMKDNCDWVTPGQDGVYEILKLDGTTMTAFVIIGSRRRELNHKTQYNVAYNYILPLDDGKARKLYVAPAAILGQTIPVHNFELSAGQTIDNIRNGNLSEGSDYAITDKNETLIVVDIDGTHITLKDPEFKHIGKGEDHKVLLGNRCKVQHNEFVDNHVTQMIKIPAGGKLRIKGTTIFVPEQCRFFKIDCDQLPWCADEIKNDLNLATMDEFVDSVTRRSKLLSIKIYNGNGELTISDDTGRVTDPLNKRAAAYDLVKTYAITPDVAENILNVPNKSQERFLAKIASSTGYALAFSDDDPDDETDGYTDLNGVLSGDAKRDLESAAQTGIKEIMDVTLLKLLAEDGSSVRMIQDLIPSLFTAMNSVGQLLFMLRAGTSLVEAYGESRTVEMELQFTKLMQRLGDAIIVLQQGRIDDISDLIEGPLASTLG